jgi:hypothetical protein
VKHITASTRSSTEISHYETLNTALPQFSILLFFLRRTSMLHQYVAKKLIMEVIQ